MFIVYYLFNIGHFVTVTQRNQTRGNKQRVEAKIASTGGWRLASGQAREEVDVTALVASAFNLNVSATGAYFIL